MQILEVHTLKHPLIEYQLLRVKYMFGINSFPYTFYSVISYRNSYREFNQLLLRFYLTEVIIKYL